MAATLRSLAVVTLPVAQVQSAFTVAREAEERSYARAFPGLAFLSAAFFAFPLIVRGITGAPRSGPIEMTVFDMALGALLFGLITFPGGDRHPKRVRTLALLYVAVMNAGLVLLTIQVPDALHIAAPLVALVAVTALSPSLLWVALTIAVQYGHFWLITARGGWVSDMNHSWALIVGSAGAGTLLVLLRFWRLARVRKTALEEVFVDNDNESDGVNTLMTTTA